MQFPPSRPSWTPISSNSTLARACHGRTTGVRSSKACIATGSTIATPLERRSRGHSCGRWLCHIQIQRSVPMIAVSMRKAVAEGTVFPSIAGLGITVHSATCTSALLGGVDEAADIWFFRGKSAFGWLPCHRRVPSVSSGCGSWAVVASQPFTAASLQRLHLPELS